MIDLRRNMLLFSDRFKEGSVAVSDKFKEGPVAL